MLDGEQIEVMELNLAIARLTFSVSCDITTFHKNRDSYLHTYRQDTYQKFTFAAKRGGKSRLVLPASRLCVRFISLCLRCNDMKLTGKLGERPVKKHQF
jgi:hypothetical protein